jgi:hypothetical protein
MIYEGLLRQLADCKIVGTDCVEIKKRALILPVMPVPDQVRDDGSGIQRRNTLKKHWIPGQARNDDKTDRRRFVNCDTVCQGEGTCANPTASGWGIKRIQ